MPHIDLIDGMDEWNSNQPGGPQIGLEDICEQPHGVNIYFDDEDDLGSAIDRIYHRKCRILRMSNWSENPSYFPDPEPEDIEKYGYDPREDMDQPEVYFRFVCSALIQWIDKN